MAEVVVVVVEVLLVVGGRKIGYRGPCTHISIVVGRVVSLGSSHEAMGLGDRWAWYSTSGEMLSLFFDF